MADADEQRRLDSQVALPAGERFSVAIVRDFEDGRVHTATVNATALELDGAMLDDCWHRTGSGSMSGSIVGLSEGQDVTVSGGGQFDFAYFPDVTWRLGLVPEPGPIDVLGRRRVAGGVVDRIVFHRAARPASATDVMLDFTSASAVPPEQHSVSVANLGSDRLIVGSGIITPDGHHHGGLSIQNTPTPTTFTYGAIPASVRESKDLHRLFATAHVTGSSEFREVSHYFSAPGTKTLTLGPPLGRVTVSQTAMAPIRRLRGRIASQPEYSAAMTVGFFSFDDADSRSISVTTTSAFLGGVPATWELEVPDFGSAYQARWGLLAQGLDVWHAVGWGGAVDVLLQKSPAHDDVVRRATSSSLASTQQVTACGVIPANLGGPLAWQSCSRWNAPR